MKILIIDDNPDELLIAKSRLKKECEGILCADGGVAGMDLAKREMPDLILLDVDMPDMSGFDVCRALKTDPELCMIPVLFLSGFVSPEDKIKGLDLGASTTSPSPSTPLNSRPACGPLCARKTCKTCSSNMPTSIP